MKEIKVKVVVPVYTAALRDEEILSMRQAASVLARYPIAIVAPPDVDTAHVEAIFNQCEVIRVTDAWLGSRNGIAGYNAMMLSREFYDLFQDAEYILICQPDAWIFRDELQAWCDKGYDYIGAPFPRKPLYELWPIKMCLRLRRWLSKGVLRQDLIGRAFNGGLSLRRVEAFAWACDRYKDRAQEFLAQGHHLYNEDIFWSLVPVDFRYPTTAEALGFAFDIKPQYCYRLTNGKLPFGCHGWFKSPYSEFWRDIIK